MQLFSLYFQGPYSQTPHLGLRSDRPHKSFGDSKAGYIRESVSVPKTRARSRVEWRSWGPLPPPFPAVASCLPIRGLEAVSPGDHISTASSAGCFSESNVLREHL